jgi:hypothetical protein
MKKANRADRKAAKGSKKKVAGSGKKPKESKQARTVALLRRPSGATMQELMTATGWKSHTVRGMISGALRKRQGLTVISDRSEQKGRIYRIPA